MILAAKIAHCWDRAMRCLGHEGFYYETTEFHYLSYGYTADAPAKVIEDGEYLMKEFTSILSTDQGSPDLEYKNTVKVRRAEPWEIPCITRDRSLWTAEKMGPPPTQ